MKKLLLPLFLSLALFALTACVTEHGGPPACEHDWVEEGVEREPTCAEKGVLALYCTICNERSTESIPTLSHTPEWVDPIPFTCTTAGVSGGQRCTECNEIISGCTPTPAAHTPTDSPAVPADCQNAGKTEGKICSVCNEVLEGCTPIPASGEHKPVSIPTVSATCAQEGSSGGTKCSVCETVLTQPTKTPMTNQHISQNVSVVNPTCKENGSKAGTVCFLCKKVLSGCEVIPATGIHSYTTVITAKPQYGVEGSKTISCATCDEERIEAIPALTYRPEDVWDGKNTSAAYESGTGTQSDPYIIATPHQLRKLASDDTAGKYYKLKNDIILNDIANYDNWASQAPANKWIWISSFKGHLDGAGFAIRGMYHANSALSGTTEYHYALFGKLENNATVVNLKVTEAYIYTPRSTVAGIAAEARPGSGTVTVKNCEFSGRLFGKNAGGIVGFAQVGSQSSTYGNLTIEGCTVNGSIQGSKNGNNTGYAGGIMANAALYNGTLTIKNCTNNAAITASTNGAGIVAFPQIYAASDRYMMASIEGCRNNGTVKSSEVAGGIVAWASSDYYSEFYKHFVLLKACINTGNVTGVEYAGGIVGRYDIATPSVSGYTITAGTRLENYGAVTATGDYATTGNYSYAGGIFGMINVNESGSRVPSLTIERTLNAGNVTGAAYAGGITGFSYGANYKTCFNEGTVVGLTAGGIEGAGETSSVRDSYNAGTVIGTDYAGGIIGRHQAEALLVSSIYNSGSVSLTAGSKGKIGAILGDSDNYVSGNSGRFFFVEGSATNPDGSEAYQTSDTSRADSYYRLTKSAATVKSSYVGFDFTETWVIQTGEMPTLMATYKTLTE